jgi:hypothetical protein
MTYLPYVRHEYHNSSQVRQAESMLCDFREILPLIFHAALQFGPEMVVL